MSNVILPIAIWASIGLAALSILVMAVTGLRSIYYGKVQMQTLGIMAVPAVLVVVLGAAMETWVQAAMYALAALFALLILGMIGTGLRQMYQSALS